jgi:hypothetical protein
MLARLGFLMTSTALNAVGGAAPASLLLDLIASATAAYSLRKLRTAYGGKACNVTRASDSATQDIGFSGNDFDVAGFNTFIAASSGSVNKWYDQSGNGNDLTVSASAPTINLTGLNGHPTSVFVSTTILNHASTPTLAQPFTVNAVAERTSNFTGYNGIIGDDSGGLFALYFNSSPNGAVIYATGSISGAATCSDSIAHSLIALFNGATSVITVDGTGTSVSTGAGSFFGLRLGVENGGLTGNLSEAMYFASQLSVGDMTTLTANQRAYWGTP